MKNHTRHQLRSCDQTGPNTYENNIIASVKHYVIYLNYIHEQNVASMGQKYIV